MKGDGEISGFGSFGGAFGADAGAVVDFAKARRLERSGSTCEVYETTLQRRRVFVKRLKSEFRDNPQYRAAFDKEFDLGVSLTHPSLPRYVALHDDYIVMDYVEGETLAELIGRKDERLRDRKWRKGLLRQLVDVIDYLHHRNVVHCDVKADNVIVSPYADRPVTLVDLDKAYTSWLDGTPGNPQNYGCKDCADGVIDFRGLGKIAEKLGEKRFAKACFDKDVTADHLRDIIKPSKTASSHDSNDIVIGFLCVLLGVGLILLMYFIGSKDSAKPDMQQHEPAKKELSDSSSTVEMTPVSESATESKRQPVAHQPAIDGLWISKMIQTKMAGLADERQKMRQMYADDTIAPHDVYVAYLDYTQKTGDCKTDIIHTAVAHYAALSELDVQKAVRSDSAWQSIERDDKELLDDHMKYLRRVRATQ